MMDICMHYGQTPAVLPSLPNTLIARASVVDLRVLLIVCTTDLSPCEDIQAVGHVLAAYLGCAEADVLTSLAFWRGAGILSIESRDREMAVTAGQADVEEIIATQPDEQAGATATVSDKTGRKTARRADIPHYSTDEVSNLLEAREEIRAYIDESARLWGKMLNVHEVTILVSLSDYLDLEWDYILAVIAHCAHMQTANGGRRSIRYVETVILNFYDEGIRDLVSLQEKLRGLERMAEAEGRLRTLFGMGSRALTPKEKKCFGTWLNDFHYDMDVIRLAYDVTVDAKGSPNLSYMNSVLANWNRDGLRTPEEVSTAQTAFRAEREKRNGTAGGSFNTEDFFEAAVRRSFGDSEP